MAVTINGTSGVTFNNGSTQSVGAVGAGSQTWTNFTASRAFSTTYTNSTGYPIMIAVQGVSAGVAGNKAVNCYVNGAVIVVNGFYTTTGNNHASFTAIIPNGATYRSDGDGVTVGSWWELR